MTQLADADLLAVWERMRLAPTARRAAALIEAAASRDAGTDAGALSVGESNRRLLAVRNSIFGKRLACVADCALCGERAEFDVDGAELAATLQAPADAPPLRLQQDGHVIELALPTVDDCIAAAETGGADEGYRLLLSRCVRGSGPDGSKLVPDALPEHLMNTIEDRLGAADPAAEITLTLQCPACGHATRAPLDLAAFFWSEIEARAPRLLSEVHLLASHYGWSEASILALDPTRRRHYVELVSS